MFITIISKTSLSENEKIVKHETLIPLRILRKAILLSQVNDVFILRWRHFPHKMSKYLKSRWKSRQIQVKENNNLYLLRDEKLYLDLKTYINDNFLINQLKICLGRDIVYEDCIKTKKGKILC